MLEELITPRPKHLSAQIGCGAAQHPSSLSHFLRFSCPWDEMVRLFGQESLVKLGQKQSWRRMSDQSAQIEYLMLRGKDMSCPRIHTMKPIATDGINSETVHRGTQAGGVLCKHSTTEEQAFPGISQSPSTEKTSLHRGSSSARVDFVH